MERTTRMQPAKQFTLHRTELQRRYTDRPLTVADLEGEGRPRLLGDGLTPSLTVLLTCDNCTVLWRHRRRFISENT